MIGHEDDEDQKRNGDSEWDALFLRLETNTKN